MQATTADLAKSIQQLCSEQNVEEEWHIQPPIDWEEGKKGKENEDDKCAETVLGELPYDSEKGKLRNLESDVEWGGNELWETAEAASATVSGSVRELHSHEAIEPSPLATTIQHQKLRIAYKAAYEEHRLRIAETGASFRIRRQDFHRNIEQLHEKLKQLNAELIERSPVLSRLKQARVEEKRRPFLSGRTGSNSKNRYAVEAQHQAQQFCEKPGGIRSQYRSHFDSLVFLELLKKTLQMATLVAWRDYVRLLEYLKTNVDEIYTKFSRSVGRTFLRAISEYMKVTRSRDCHIVERLRKSRVRAMAVCISHWAHRAKQRLAETWRFRRVQDHVKLSGWRKAFALWRRVLENSCSQRQYFRKWRYWTESMNEFVSNKRNVLLKRKWMLWWFQMMKVHQKQTKKAILAALYEIWKEQENSRNAVAMSHRDTHLSMNAWSAWRIRVDKAVKHKMVTLQLANRRLAKYWLEWRTAVQILTALSVNRGILSKKRKHTLLRVWKEAFEAKNILNICVARCGKVVLSYTWGKWIRYHRGADLLKRVFLQASCRWERRIHHGLFSHQYSILLHSFQAWRDQAMIQKSDRRLEALEIAGSTHHRINLLAKSFYNLHNFARLCHKRHEAADKIFQLTFMRKVLRAIASLCKQEQNRQLETTRQHRDCRLKKLAIKVLKCYWLSRRKRKILKKTILLGWKQEW